MRGIRFSSVTATDLASVRDEEAADSGFGHWVAVRRGVLVLYFISLGLWSAHYGIPVQRELVVAWVCGALACASLGRPWREVLRLVRDWLPIVILLSAYDFTRAADSLDFDVVPVGVDHERGVVAGVVHGALARPAVALIAGGERGRVEVPHRGGLAGGKRDVDVLRERPAVVDQREATTSAPN